MNEQEYETLSALLARLVAARVVNKDPQADSMIREATARQPESAYLLVQRAMLMERALMAAQKRIADLEQRVRTQENSGFLRDADWAAELPRSVRGDVERVGVVSPRGARYGFAGERAGMSNFLGSAAATAAGVAAGAFLFQGLDHLFADKGTAGAEAAGLGGAEAAADGITANNYYLDPDAPDGALRRADFGGDDDTDAPDSDNWA